MKKFIFILCIFLFATTQTKANSINYYNNNQPIIFIESGVEYAVFENGEFDFNILQTNRGHVNVNINRNIGVSFNSGRVYQNIDRNRYGDIININSTPIFYNNRGQVKRIGNVSMMYDRFGEISNVGNLYVNRSNNQCNYRGFVNRTNYNYRPLFFNYKRPIVHHHSYTYYGRSSNRPRNNNVASRAYGNKRNNVYNKYNKKNKFKNYKSSQNNTPKVVRKTRTTERSYSYVNNNKGSRIR